MTGIHKQLKWESLKKRRMDNRLFLFNACKPLKGTARIPTDDIISKTRCDRNQPALAFQIPSARVVKIPISTASSPTPEHYKGLE